MSFNTQMFFILYGLSMIPWTIAWFMPTYKSLTGLSIINVTLTISSYIFLGYVLHWWIIAVILGLFGLSKFLYSVHLNPYSKERFVNVKR